MSCWYSSFLINSLLLLGASAAYADGPTVTRVLHQAATVSSFDMCHGGGCADISHVSLTKEEWQQVINVFDPKPIDAEGERKCIAIAIGLMEKIVGAKTGTDTDRGGTFGNSNYLGQLDCNDESTNSTTYMRLMNQAGLIRFHEILDTKTRGFFLNGWPHTTAVIREKQADQLGSKSYAVDSWFYDNGKPAVIIPLTLWETGWKPTNTAAN
jgi:hypothetical protein